MKVEIVFWGNHLEVDSGDLLPPEIAEVTELYEATSFDHLKELLDTHLNIRLVITCLNPADLQALVYVQQVQTQHPDIALVAILDTMLRNSTVADAVQLVLGGIKNQVQATEHEQIVAVPHEQAIENNPFELEEPVEECKLTPRQRDVLGLLMHGKSNKQIARILGLSEGTIKIHCMAIFRQLGVANRTQAAMRAERVLPQLMEMS